MLHSYVNSMLKLVFSFAMDQVELLFMEDKQRTELVLKTFPLFLHYIMGR